MTNLQLKNAYNLLDKTVYEIRSLTNDIITKILDHNGFSVDYVKSHPEEFCILKKPAYRLQDITDIFIIMHKGTTLGTYAIHYHIDLDNIRMTCRIDYTLGSDS